VTWTYFGGQINNASSLSLGIFEVSTINYQNSGDLPPEPTTATYGYSLDGGSNNGGTTVNNGTVELEQGGLGSQSVAPEPSSLIAPLTVLLGLPVVKLLRSRKQRRQQAS
jgi:hypothetical protein